MSLLFRLAWRNLSRHKLRSALTAVSIVAGVGVLVLGEALVGGIGENFLGAAEETHLGHLVVRPADYPTRGASLPLEKLVQLTPAARALLDGEAVAWTGRVLFAPVVVHGADSIRARAIGLEPGTDEKVFPRTRWKVEGRFPAAEAEEIAVAPSVARLLSLAPGDRVVLQVRTHQGVLKSLEVSVVGVVSTGNMGLDVLGLFVPMELTKKLTGVDGPTHVAVKLGARGDAAAFKPRLAAALGPEVAVATLAEETAELAELQKARQASFDLLVFIILALAAFGIANAFLMAASERTREVGTLRAMGMTEGAVTRLFLLEGALLGLFGSLLGVAWGGGLSGWFAAHPLDFSAAVEHASVGTLPMSALIYARFNAPMLAWGLVLGVGVSLLASWYPARVAAALRPADAVRA